MSTIRNYILVDDDPFNNIISNMEIEAALGEVNVTTFEIPEDGLVFIQHEYIKNLIPTVLFLDINMPSLSGWQFLEKFEKFSEELKFKISIYILSSSIDPRDMDKAKANKYIRGYIAKPLESNVILSIAG
jgi:response regulator RpfG family c-di-GMP phosphodiesterase